MLLGIVIIVFCIAGGSIELSNSYKEYQTHMQANGGEGNPLTVMDELRWQVARLVGGAGVAGGLISGAMLMALAWIGKNMEQVGHALDREPAQQPARRTWAPA